MSNKGFEQDIVTHDLTTHTFTLVFLDIFGTISRSCKCFYVFKYDY